MAAAVDWSALTLPGAFIVGALVGGLVVIRAFRYVLEYLSRRGK